MRAAWHPSPQDDQHTPGYRTVAVYWTVAEAELARSVLAADGVPVAALDLVDATLLPGTAPVRLLVPADELERARLLLDGDAPGATADSSISAEPVGAPPAVWSRLALGLAVLALLLAGLLLFHGA